VLVGLVDLPSALMDETGTQPQTFHDEGFQDFRDFVNFIDGVGLSAQWTPEYDFDWLRVGEQQQQQQESRRHSREPEAPSSPVPEDIGTPFSTWLPSAPADDQVNLRSNSGDGMLSSLTIRSIKYCGICAN
jgi:hypothetical protein